MKKPIIATIFILAFIVIVSNQRYQHRTIQAAPLGQSGMPAFTDIAPSLGVDLVVTTYGPNVVDYNQDGQVDLLFTNHFDLLTLYQQQALDDFVDITAVAGITLGSSTDFGDKHGAAWGDCDNDGNLDLYVSRGSQQPNQLYYNLGDNTFSEIANSAGVADANRGRAAAWIDYDKDGDLDLFITNARDSKDIMFSNQGSCVFTNVSAQVGALTERLHKFGMGWADYDQDGDMDVFATSGASLMGNELDFHSHLYRNNGDGTFANVTDSAGIPEQPGNGLAWGDYDNDGDLDLFVTIGYSPGVSSPPNVTNRLYRNNSDGTFTEIAAQAGVAQNLNSQHAAWADFDNDGDLDLYVTNAGTLANSNQPNFLFENQGDGTFQEVAAAVGATGDTVGMSGGVAIGDINDDGFPDIVITHGLSSYSQVEGPHQVLHNQGNDANWLKVKLIGQQSNRLGVGARVELQAADGLFQMREMNGGMHNYAQDELMLTFGLGARTQVSRLTIYWPSGVVQQVMDLDVNRQATIVEAQTTEPTSTPEFTPTITATLSATDTPLPPTPTETMTLTPTATNTPPPTPTQTPTETSTPEPTATPPHTSTLQPTPTGPVEIIIDNEDVEFAATGFWNVNSRAQYPKYSDNFRFTGAGAANRQATFTPNIEAAGDYEVFIWYLTSTRLATNIPYTINFNGGSVTLRLNHQGEIGGGVWHSLGVYNFASDASETIVITNEADGFVYADAVRLVIVQK